MSYIDLIKTLGWTVEAKIPEGYTAHNGDQSSPAFDSLDALSEWVAKQPRGELGVKPEGRWNTKLSGGGPVSNKTTEADSRRPLE